MNINDKIIPLRVIAKVVSTIGALSFVAIIADVRFGATLTAAGRIESVDVERDGRFSLGLSSREARWALSRVWLPDPPRTGSVVRVRQTVGWWSRRGYPPTLEVGQ